MGAVVALAAKVVTAVARPHGQEHALMGSTDFFLARYQAVLRWSFVTSVEHNSEAFKRVVCSCARKYWMGEHHQELTNRRREMENVQAGDCNPRPTYDVTCTYIRINRPKSPDGR